MAFNLFSAIPTRSNGDKILYSWFNAIRSAGVALENWIGAGGVSGYTSSCDNNAGATDLTNLIFDKGQYRAAIAFVSIVRKTSLSELRAVGFLSLAYYSGTDSWDLTATLPGDETGVTFSITTDGQVKYATDNMAGTGYVGYISYKAISFGQ